MENEATGPQQYLTFHIGAEEYALSILRVREIIEFPPLTRVPSMPPSVRGVLKLRGIVLPVVDLAFRFGVPDRAVTKHTCVIIVDIRFKDRSTTLGLIADSVNEVIELHADQVEPPPAFGCCAAEYLIGFAMAQDGFVMMLDVDRALSAEALKLEQLTKDAAALESAELAEAATGTC